MIVSIWDDGYGISVPNEFQITKGDISELLKASSAIRSRSQGYDIYTVKAGTTPALCETYIAAAQIVRMEHVPAIIHVDRDDAAAGALHFRHHERYKSKERLAWEIEFDCIRKMREWMIGQGIATAEELDGLEREDLRLVREAQRRAWDDLSRADRRRGARPPSGMLDELARSGSNRDERCQKLRQRASQAPYRRDAMHGADQPR